MSDAEREEAATTVAHRVDEQVRGPPVCCCCVCAAVTCSPLCAHCMLVSDGVRACACVGVGQVSVSELSSCLS